MATQLTAPRMGEGVEELTLVKWLKKEGDMVAELESIVELETDKVATEIPSPASGTVLKILIAEGTQVQVGEILAWIGEAGEKIPTQTASAPKQKESTLPTEKTKLETEKKTTPADTFLSPLVRKMIEENDLDATQIKGRGKDGRITKQDVLDALLKVNQLKPAVQATQEHLMGTPQPSENKRILPISTMRQIIAARMLESSQNVPHVLTVMDADMSGILAHRALNKFLFEQDGVRLTLTAYFISAIAAGLKSNPMANSSWSAEGLTLHYEVNIGMAVSLGADGLIVPVIQNADTLSLLGIARAVNDLAERARTKKLLPEEVRGATFSLTNHGLGGSLFATPIITLPQVGILGTGAMQKRAVVVTDDQGNDSIAIRPMIYLSFVFDHRVLDGESADAFLSKVKETLEDWR